MNTKVPMFTDCTVKHTPILVNNRYLNGKHVIEGGEWVLEKVCSKCGMRLDTPEFYKELLVNLK